MRLPTLMPFPQGKWRGSFAIPADPLLLLICQCDLSLLLVGVTMATTAKQRVIALLRGQEAKRIRFIATTATAGDITINHTTFATVANAIESHKVKVTVKAHFDNEDVEAQYDPDAVPALGMIPGSRRVSCWFHRSWVETKRVLRCTNARTPSLTSSRSTLERPRKKLSAMWSVPCMNA